MNTNAARLSGVPMSREELRFLMTALRLVAGHGLVRCGDEHRRMRKVYARLASAYLLASGETGLGLNRAACRMFADTDLDAATAAGGDFEKVAGLTEVGRETYGDRSANE